MPEIFCDSDIKKLIVDGRITHVDGLDLMPSVQPSSLDVVLPMVGYEVDAGFNTHGQDVSDVVDKNGYPRFDISNGVDLLKGKRYLFRCMTIELPTKMYLEASPKSSIGRVDLLVRSIFDNSTLYDRTPKGYKGDIWVEITPQSFSVKVIAGLPVTQLNIISKADYQLNISENKEIMKIVGEKCLMFDDNTLILDLSVPKTGLVGYVAKDTDEILDMTKNYHLDPTKFFEPIMGEDLNNGQLILQKSKFYILTNKTPVAIPPVLSAEMLPLSHYIGELRVHYAGYFDPGFGFGRVGEVGGNNGVLEVRPYENYTAVDGQSIVLLRYYRNSGPVAAPYGFAGNNYANQKGVRLAKYFKMEG